jgi:hypothetical protein
MRCPITSRDGRGGTRRSITRSGAHSTRARGIRGRLGVSWLDDDPEVAAERERYERSKRGAAAEPNGAANDDGGLGEWDAGEDDWQIPPREWLLGNVFCRRFVSSLLADGAVGKTTVRIAQLLGCATGRPLTGEHVFQRCRVLLVSAEDDRDELRRRVRAAMLYYSIADQDLKGWFLLATIGPRGWKLATVENGVRKISELRDRLIHTITRHKIDIVSCDPFVKLHAVEENSNDAIDFVTGLLANIADEYNCAVDAPHHVSKGSVDPGNANRGRGASAFKDAARLVYSLAGMSDEEAALFKIDAGERLRFIRMDHAKVNLAPPPKSAKWFEIVGVSLNNGTPRYPNGDEIGVAVPWEPPDLWRGISDFTANAILDEIDAGLDDGKQFYSDHAKATDRAASDVVRKHLPELSDVQARDVIKTWLKKGVLRHETYHDEAARKPRQGLRVNPAQRPGPRAAP